MNYDALRRAIRIIEKAQAMTQEMRDYITRTHLLDFAERQLRFMSDVLKSGRTPTDEEKKQVSLGRMAIQEFEGGKFNDYAVILEEADGAFSLLE